VTGDAVSIDNFAFVPATLTVKTGSTVTWTNHDEEPHTVAASDGSFHSPGMGSQGTYSHTFATAGKFDYVCSIHPFMHATVVVTQ
jgi:plastocyanin